MAARVMSLYQSPEGGRCERTETDLAWAFFRPFPFLSYDARRAYHPQQSRRRRQ
jgi:hypothetical protein